MTEPLYNARTPAKCGKMRGATVMTIIAAKPTVSAWRNSPQMPP